MLGLPIPLLLINLISLVIAITVHEFAHAITADRLGDLTPRKQGRITLNPLMHLDPFGSILMIVSGFGWGRPVMVNPYSLRAPIKTSWALVAAAGPFSNLILAMLAAIPVRLGLFQFFDLPGIEGWTPSLSQFIEGFILINIGLMLFNLIPIAPLDGSKIAVGLLPREWAEPIERLEPYGPMLLMLLLISGRFGLDVFGLIMRPAQTSLYHLITGL